MPMLSFGVSKQDFWLSAIIATVLGMAVVYLIVALGLRYPTQTVVEFSQQIAGRWLGRVIGAVYILYFLLLTVSTTRDFADYFVMHVLPHTPLYVFLGFELLMAVYAVSQGLETIARTAVILVPLTLLVIIFGVLGNLPQIDFLKMLPVLKNGWQPVFKDGLTEVPYMGMAVFWLFLLPAVKHKEKARGTMLFSVAIVGLCLLVAAFTVIMVLGTVRPVFYNYQFFMAFREIQLFNFIERVEPLFVIVWSITGYLAVTIFFYGTVHLARQWLGCRSVRPLLLPVSLVVFFLCIYLFPSYLSLRQFFRLERFGLLSFPVQFAIPLLLLVADLVKKRAAARTIINNSRTIHAFKRKEE